MNRLRSARALPAVVLALLSVGCGGGSFSDQNRPQVLSVFPADGQAISGWLGEARVTFDQPVHVLDDSAVSMSSDLEDLAARAFVDPTDPNSILILPIVGHFTPGRLTGINIREGIVFNDERHYLADEVEWNFTVGPRPDVFVASSDGNVYEINPDDGTQVGVTAPPPGFAAFDVLGGDDEVFVWLRKLGVGSDQLAYFVPGAATMTPVALSGETGAVHGVGFTLAIDGKRIYATAQDAANQRIRVHRVSTVTRSEIPTSLELSPVTPLPDVARTPTVDPARNRLYVAHADGTGAGLLSVVDLATFTQVDADSGPGLSLPMPEGAGDLHFGPFSDRAWMTLAQVPHAVTVVIDPNNFAVYTSHEPAFTANAVSSVLTPGDEFFVQGLANYTGTTGIVYTRSDEIGDGFGREVLDDVGGTLQGGNRIGALLNDPGSHNLLAFSSNGTSTVMCVFDVYDFDLLQIDVDTVTAGVQGYDLSTVAPGNIVAATFVRGELPP